MSRKSFFDKKFQGKKAPVTTKRCKKNSWFFDDDVSLRTEKFFSAHYDELIVAPLAQFASWGESNELLYLAPLELVPGINQIPVSKSQLEKLTRKELGKFLPKRLLGGLKIGFSGGLYEVNLIFAS